MDGHLRVVAALIAVLLLAFCGSAVAHGDEDGKGSPVVAAMPATQVGVGGALLQANVDAKDRATSLFFEYGPTAAYGFQTPPISAGRWKGPRPIAARVDGLAAATTYHFRAVATNDRGTTRGADRIFTTLASAGGEGELPAPAIDPVADGPTPKTATTVGVTPARGDVRVKVPGATGFVLLSGGDTLPVGTVVDTSRGAVALTAALPSGQIQTGRFGGGRFEVGQGRRGVVQLYLRGRVCGRRPGASTTADGPVAASSARRRRSGRRLWGRDHGGRFRTHGRNSHATVRGTRWLVEDRCEGTLTLVTKGAVVVKDLVRGKRRLLRAGERYLARPRG
jgi:hypothetical protein